MTERCDFVDLIHCRVPDELVAVAEDVIDCSIRQQQHRVAAVAAHERHPEITAVLWKFGSRHVLRPKLIVIPERVRYNGRARIGYGYTESGRICSAE